MPKVTTPKAPATPTPEPEAPAIDIAPLITSLSPLLSGVAEAEQKIDTATVDIAVECRAFRADNPTLERNSMKLAIQTAVAESYGLKLEDVQSKPDALSPNANAAATEKFKKRNSTYTLVSVLLSIAWPKDEKQDAKVAKLLSGGETRFVVLKKAAQKPQANAARDPDAGKITAANLAEKHFAFLSKAQSDMAVPMEEILDAIEEHTNAVREALVNPPAPAAQAA